MAELKTRLPDPIANIENDCIKWGLSTAPTEAVLKNFTQDSDTRISFFNFSDFLIDAVDGFKPNAHREKQAASQKLIDWLLPKNNLPPAILILLSSEKVASRPQEQLAFNRRAIIPLLYCYETFPEKSLRLMNRTVAMKPTLASLKTKTPAARFIESGGEYDMVHVVDIDPATPGFLRQWRVTKRENIRNPHLVIDQNDPAFFPIALEQLFDRYEREIHSQNMESIEKHRG